MLYGLAHNVVFLFLAADAVRDTAAQVQTAAERNDEGGQLKNTVGQDTGQIGQQGKTIMDIIGGKQAQENGIETERKGWQADRRLLYGVICPFSDDSDTAVSALYELSDLFCVRRFI